jgi:hypothetical protein
MSDGRVRTYQDGDEHAIVALFRATFDVPRTIERWRWQFVDHPQGAGWIHLGERDGEIVAQYCMMRHDLNLLGRRIAAAQSCDTMVRGDQRRQGWFVRLARANYQQASEKGVRAAIGFPIRSSFPGLVGSLEWDRIATLREFSYRIGYARIWGPLIDRAFQLALRVRLALRCRVLRLSAPGVRVEAVASLPDEIEGLLAEIRPQEILGVWKDLDYLRWRYEKHPEHSYDFYVLARDGKLEGLLVSRQVGDTVAICELLHRTKNVAESALLVSAVVRANLGGPLQRIEFFGHDDGFFASVFARCGFQASYAAAFVFCGKLFDDDELLRRRFAHARNWTVVYGDTDVI